MKLETNKSWGYRMFGRLGYDPRTLGDMADYARKRNSGVSVIVWHSIETPCGHNGLPFYMYTYRVTASLSYGTRGNAVVELGRISGGPDQGHIIGECNPIERLHSEKAFDIVKEAGEFLKELGIEASLDTTKFFLTRHEYESVPESLRDI